MGKLRERTVPFYAMPSTFAAAFPTVDLAIVRFTETDFGQDPHIRVHNLADGPRLACGNPRCNRGGYDFALQLAEMVRQRLTSEDVDMSCRGDEGSPKGRNKGQNCLMSIQGEITIKYKEPAEIVKAT
jgi:hypothetical protein